jgi:Polyketide cyclase / dehydrase and lipid transport
LIGEGVGQLRRLETRDGREIVERLEEFDETERSYRYTLVAGVPASHYAGVIDVRPKGNGSVAEWRVEFLANSQPDIVVRTMVSTLIKTGLGSLKPRFAATI